jgi:undecaprenyl-diphosphatase
MPRRALFPTIAAAGVAFVLLTVAVVAGFAPVLRLDVAVSAAAHHAALAQPAWRSAMYGITLTGGTPVIGVGAAAGCMVLLWRRRWPQALFVVVALSVTLVLRLIIVNAIARPRPADRLAPAAGWSFPSGHTTASATAALIAIIVAWPLLHARWSRIVLCCVAGAWAVAVGISRVALVVHWPSDVVGGWLLVGTVVPAIAVMLRRAVSER